MKKKIQALIHGLVQPEKSHSNGKNLPGTILDKLQSSFSTASTLLWQLLPSLASIPLPHCNAVCHITFQNILIEESQYTRKYNHGYVKIREYSLLSMFRKNQFPAFSAK
ncbi:MAG: hypothetical protein LIO99_08905 [Clostridiales bacterium]|nr:hypothetical protein [Clostridiales bacterium]